MPSTKFRPLNLYRNLLTVKESLPVCIKSSQPSVVSVRILRIVKSANGLRPDVFPPNLKPLNSFL